MRLSPSVLNSFLECEHLVALELAVARGALERPLVDNPQADLIRRKGEEHEAAYLAQLLAHGKTVVEPADADDAGRLIREATYDVIYQPSFEDAAGWRGRADFLERQPDGTYEVVDTKLARHAKPYYILQLCFYSEQLARVRRARLLPARGVRCLLPPGAAPARGVRRRPAADGAVAGPALRHLRLPRAVRGALGARRPPLARRGDP